MAINLMKTDVVIVGLGAVGGVAALPLAKAGLDVIGLEAGAWLTPADFAPDELRNNFRGWPQAVQKANHEVPTHRPNASAPYSPRPTIHPMMNAVGGTTLHYWAQSWRLNPWDFKVVSETTRRYGAARIPAGSTVEDCQWGPAWKAFLKENADRWNTAYLQKTTLPYEDNRLDLDPSVKDPLGFPVCRITAEYKDNEKKIAAFIQDKMVDWFMTAGAVATEKSPIGLMGPTTHAYGGTRMGNNPDTNVVDRWGFSHEAPNLGILGASVMGTSGAHNPTLTAQALSWRTAEYLGKNWNTIAK